MTVPGAGGGDGGPAPNDRGIVTTNGSAPTTPAPTGADTGEPRSPGRVLTITEAARETGLSTKAIARRIERGTLQAILNDQGQRVVARAELESRGLLVEGHPGVSPAGRGGELVVYRDLFERERTAREAADERARQLELDLTAIANAGPFRALRLRRQLRARPPVTPR